MGNNTLSLETAHFLTGPDAADALAALQPNDLTDATVMGTLMHLRNRFTPQQAGALVTLARLRRQATVKFPQAEKLFFTQEALQQATSQPVAQRHAQQLHTLAGPGPILDLGCGIGGDTLELASLRPVIAYERNPVRLHFAQANAKVLGLAAQIEFHSRDWTVELAAGNLPSAAAAFVDPARRRDGRRVFSLHEMVPNLNWLLRLRATIPLTVAKVMPGVEDEEVPAECSVEFIGYDGQCKEALLWFGHKTGPQRAATILGDTTWTTVPASEASPPLGPVEAGMALFEPHPALIRAGAFAELCEVLTAHLFDPQIAYLVSHHARRHPLVQSFIIDEVHDFSLKLLNRRLRALKIGRVELKKRGFPLEPEELRPRLRLTSGGTQATIIFTRQQDRRLMLIGRRLRQAV